MSRHPFLFLSVSAIRGFECGAFSNCDVVNLW